MKWLQVITEKLKKSILQHFGFIRLMEWRNQVVLAPWVPAVWWAEVRDKARLRKEMGGILPHAHVACIVPTYRRHDMVLQAVDSILKQDFQDFVVIIVDDGAGLPKLPDDPRVFGVSLARNTGIAGVVRNVGIGLTSSPYIAFLDDDNTWKPNHLRVCLEALTEGQDLVYTAVVRRTASGRELDVLSAPFDREELTHSTSVDTSAIMVRRGRGVRFSRLPRGRTTMPGEDWEFVYRLSRKAKVTHVQTITVDYLINPESFYTPWEEATTR